MTYLAGEKKRRREDLNTCITPCNVSLTVIAIETGVCHMQLNAKTVKEASRRFGVVDNNPPRELTGDAC